MDIPLDAEVLCTDGAGGRSTCLIINPVTKEITHLVVQTKTFFTMSIWYRFHLLRKAGRNMSNCAALVKK